MLSPPAMSPKPTKIPRRKTLGFNWRSTASWHLCFPAATVAGWLIGAALDRWLHTTWLYMAGLILGIAAGFVELIRAALSPMRLQMIQRRALDHRHAKQRGFLLGALERISRIMIVLAVRSERRCLVALRLARRSGIRLRLRRAYLNFHWLKRVVAALADRATQSRQTAIQQGNGVALPASLRFDGPRSLCYIHCFSRESLRAFCGPVPARSGHRVRSRLRGVGGCWRAASDVIHLKHEVRVIELVAES